MKKSVIIILFAGATLLMADGASSYAKCAGCHGTNGEKVALGKSAIITGQDVEKTIEQLNGYKAGTLDLYGMSNLMKGQVSSMDDESIQEVAEYIAGMK